MTVLNGDMWWTIFHFSLPGIKKVVFNLGDLFVFLGTALFLLGEMGEEFKKK